MAFPLGNTGVAGYPQPFGTKIQNMVDHTGPALYTQFTTPTTGGDVLNAADLGMGGFDQVDSAIDTTGQFRVDAILSLGGVGNAVPKVILVYTALATGTIAGQSQTINTQAAASSVLSAFSFRLNILGV